MSAIKTLTQIGQSLWYDNIQRSLLMDGSLKRLIDDGEIRGVTSNPSIFHNAIAKSRDYDAALIPMAWSGWSTERIFTRLAVEDIRSAADLFQPLYLQTNGGDGYVSLEVNPYLAKDTQGTLREARRLWEMVQRPNLMIKIPATAEGIPAIREAIADGINVNVTLIFSLQRYAEVMDAYLTGLERRLAAGQPIGMIASVASFFVSRLDVKVDDRLNQLVEQEGGNAEKALRLLGKAAIANAKLAYAQYREIFTSPRFITLKEHGANVQRPLWASTSTKNPAYRDVMYVEELIGPETVNTVPPKTLDAFRDHGEARSTLQLGLDEAREALAALETLGISLNQVTQELEQEGVQAFSDAYTALLKTLDERRLFALAELGPLQDAVAKNVGELEQDGFAMRVHAHDARLWAEDPEGQAEVARRMGWLTSPEDSLALVGEIQSLASDLAGEGYTHALLLGMGGSSLAPEVIRSVMGLGSIEGKPGLDLLVLDSTDPQQVLEAEQWCAGSQTIYIVASKSGGTSEVNAFLDYFWAKAEREFGEQAARHFIAITDPGTSLNQLATERKFRQLFLADPNVGGRYSALTAFGLVPSGLMGHDLHGMLATAGWMAAQCGLDVPEGRNPGLVLGVILGEAARAGLDKVIFLADPLWQPLGAWLEQLIAESSGKQSRGILPVDGEPHREPGWYSNDRIFIYLKAGGELADFAQALLAEGFPVISLETPDAADLPAEFYRWEFATAVACALIGVNAFDQPDVQDNKIRTSRKMSDYLRSGSLGDEKLIWDGKGARLYGPPFPGFSEFQPLDESLKAFLARAEKGDFVAINAYLPRNPQTFEQLQGLRRRIQDLTKLPTTLGFGPRFLHSTGQYHMGGKNEGLFIQVTADPRTDLDVPGRGYSFGILEHAQALGDLEALVARARKAVRVHLEDKSVDDLLK